MLAPLPRPDGAAALMAILALLLVSSGCHRQAPPPPVARPVRIPPGCEADLSGEYTFKGRDDWRYLAGDDGGTLTLRLVRTSPDGGAGVQRSDGGTAIIVERTPDGFVGATHAVAWPSPGVACPVSFPTEVTACPDAGLVLRAVDAVGVDETCRAAPATGAPLRKVDLVKGPPSAAPVGPDGGG